MIALTPDELEALYGLPHAQQLLYIRLKQFMDYTTGIVGQRRRISYQSLRETMCVEATPGRHQHGTPTKSAIRNWLSALEKGGLLDRLGDLVFKFRLISAPFSVQNSNGTGTAQEQHGSSTPPESHINVSEISHLGFTDDPRNNTGATQEQHRSSDTPHNSCENCEICEKCENENDRKTIRLCR